MAREKALVMIGDVFPELELDLWSGERILFPGTPGGKSTLLLFYCGDTCPKCRERLSDFQRIVREGQREDVRVLAVSGDDRALAAKTAFDLRISFPLAYRADVATMRNGLRAACESEKDDIHPKAFVVDTDGRIANAFSNDEASLDWFRSNGRCGEHVRKAGGDQRNTDGKYLVNGPVRQFSFH